MIVIAGKAGSGKDTLADYLAAKHRFTKVSLADPMKEFCAKIFSWDARRLWGASELRNQPDPIWDGLSAREALQWLGTEWGRKCHPDLWVRYLLRTAPDKSVVADIRFPNELALLRAGGATSVLLTGSHRPLTVGAEHVSEQTEWGFLLGAFDVVLPKFATAVDMCHAADEALTRLGAL